MSTAVDVMVLVVVFPPALRLPSWWWCGTAWLRRTHPSGHMELGSICSQHKQHCGRDPVHFSLGGRTWSRQRKQTQSWVLPGSKERGCFVTPTHNQRSCYGVLWSPSRLCLGNAERGARPALNPGNTGVHIPVPTSHATLGKSHLPLDPVPLLS